MQHAGRLQEKAAGKHLISRWIKKEGSNPHPTVKSQMHRHILQQMQPQLQPRMDPKCLCNVIVAPAGEASPGKSCWRGSLEQHTVASSAPSGKIPHRRWCCHLPPVCSASLSGEEGKADGEMWLSLPCCRLGSGLLCMPCRGREAGTSQPSFKGALKTYIEEKACVWPLLLCSAQGRALGPSLLNTFGCSFLRELNAFVPAVFF